METRINIAEILRNKPHGVKLYSPIFGECTFCYIHGDTNDICVKRSYNVMSYFNFEGLYNTAGECLLFPSKEMRDWNKFAWKKGDVLTNSSEFQIFFDKWANEDYTKFLGKIKLLGDSHCYDTANYSLASKEEALEFIKSVEEINNGKLNRETLEVEKTQPEFKDGDILSIQEDEEHYHAILIFKGGTDVYVYFDYFHRVLTYGTKIDENEKYISHLATDEEKQQLLSALKKENKSWDADKKMFVDLKPKVDLKPFDKVLVRDNEDDIWEVSLFGYKDDELYYRCDNGIQWIQCIPYDGNEHLLGTTNNVEG